MPSMPEIKENRREIKIRDNKCRRKADDTMQLTFTLIEQDKSSPEVIAYWILKNIETAPAEKLFDALESAILMREYIGRKIAD